MIPSFRILGDFPSFRLLGFGGIFRRSVIPRFHLLGFGGIFRRSVIPPFRHSAVPSFLLLGSPVADIRFLTTLHASLYKETKFIDHSIDKWANLPIHKECYFKVI